MTEFSAIFKGQVCGERFASVALIVFLNLASAQAGCSDSQTGSRGAAEAGANSEGGASNEEVGDAGSGATTPLEPDGFGAGGTSSSEEEGGAGGEIDSVVHLPIPIVSATDPQSAWSYSLADLALADAYAECSTNPQLAQPWTAAESGRGNPVWAALEVAMETAMETWRKERGIERPASVSDWLSYRNDALYNRSRADAMRARAGLESQSWHSTRLLIDDIPLALAAERAQRAVDAAGLHLCTAERLSRDVLWEAFDGAPMERLELLEWQRESAQVALLQYLSLLATVGPLQRLTLEESVQANAHHVAAFLNQWATEQSDAHRLDAILAAWFSSLDRSISLYTSTVEREANTVGVQTPVPAAGAALAMGARSWPQRLLALLYGGDPLADATSLGLQRVVDRTAPGAVIDTALRAPEEWPRTDELPSSVAAPPVEVVAPRFARNVAYYFRAGVDHRVPEAFLTGDSNALMRVGDDQGLSADGLDADSMRLLGGVATLQQLRHALRFLAARPGMRNAVASGASKLSEEHASELSRLAGDDACQVTPMTETQLRIWNTPGVAPEYTLLHQVQSDEVAGEIVKFHVWRVSLAKAILSETVASDSVKLLALRGAPEAFALAHAASLGDPNALRALGALLSAKQSQRELLSSAVTFNEQGAYVTLLVPFDQRVQGDANFTLLLRRTGEWSTDYWPVANHVAMLGWEFQRRTTGELGQFSPIQSLELTLKGDLSATFATLFRPQVP